MVCARRLEFVRLPTVTFGVTEAVASSAMDGAATAVATPVRVSDGTGNLGACVLRHAGGGSSGGAPFFAAAATGAGFETMSEHRSLRVLLALALAIGGVAAGATAAGSVPAVDPIDEAAAVPEQAVAVRLQPPAELDCTAVRMHVMGNSIDSDFGVRDPATIWPRQMQDGLNASPMLDGLRIINSAVPGSTVVRQNPWDPLGEQPAFRFVTHVHSVIASIPTAARSRAIVIIHPSFIDLQDTTVSDAVAVQRSVDGIRSVVNSFNAAGITRVIVLPTLPVGRRTNDLHIFFIAVDLQSRIAAQNAALVTAGFVPAGIRSSLYDATGYGNPVYFDGFSPLDPTTGPDDMHPDADGHRVVAADVGTDPRLVAALAASCTR